jgi:WD40 repeat protein
LLLADVETEDSLPLLAFTLRELWEHDGGQRRLGVATYRDVLGGVHGAVARAAEAVLAAQPLTAEQEEDLRSAFLAMVRLGETQQYTRQPVRWRDLPERAAPLLERFVAARLLVSGSENDERVLEVAHEALFRVWTRAKNWLDADRDNLRLREGIRQAAREWSERGRAPELLVHRGSRLEAAEALAQQRRFPLEPVQRDYVQACIDAREAERAAEQRRIAARRRRVQITIASLSIGLVVVSALGLWALRERRQATDRLASLHWVNAVTELERADDLKASHHFMQVFALSNDAADARNALLAGELLSGNAVLAAILQPPGGIEAAAFARGSDRVVTWSAAGTARVWDLRTGGFEEAPLHEGTARKVVASPLGKRVVLWFGDDAIEVRDSDTGRALATASGAGGLPVFSGSETRFAIRDEDTVRIWDEVRGEPVAVLKHPDRVRGVVLSAQGERALTWDAKGVARLWNPDRGEKLAELAHGGEVSAAVIGDDLQQVLLWGKDGPPTLWRGAGLARLELGSSGATNPSIMGAAFFANGRRILTWNHGGVGLARIFDAETGKEVARLRHRQAVRNAAFDRAQSRVLTWSDDGTARVWNSADGKLRSVLRHEDEVRGAAFSPDETRILTWGNDGNARVWDVASGQPLSLGLRHDGPVRGAAFGPDGRSILSFDERSARLWQQRPDRERRIGTLDHAEGVLSASFAAGAGDVLTLTRDGRLHRWAGDERKPTAVALPRRLAGGAFDAGGERVVGWSADHVIGIWSTRDGRELAAPMRHERSDLGVLGAAFSGDGSRVVSWGDDKTARVWDAGTGKLLALLRHPSTVSGAVSSRDQTRIVTWSIDRIVRLWDVRDQALAASLPAHEYGVQGAALAGDNARIMTWDAGGTVRLWDARSGGALKHYRDGAGGPVRGARWSGDEGRILSWDERTVGIRDSRREGKPGERIVWDAGSVLKASFNADERIVLTAGDDGARLWNARSGQPLTRWMTLPGSMQGAALRSDEGVLLAWSDQTVRTWNVAVGEGLAGEVAVAMQQARTGTRLGSVGQVELIPAEEWRALRDHHLEPGKPGR